MYLHVYLMVHFSSCFKNTYSFKNVSTHRLAVISGQFWQIYPLIGFPAQKLEWHVSPDHRKDSGYIWNGQFPAKYVQKMVYRWNITEWCCIFYLFIHISAAECGFWCCKLRPKMKEKPFCNPGTRELPKIPLSFTRSETASFRPSANSNLWQNPMQFFMH